MQRFKDKNHLSLILALAKKNVEGALNNVFKKPLKVKLANDKPFYSYFNKISNSIDKVVSSIEEMQEISLEEVKRERVERGAKDTSFLSAQTQLNEVVKGLASQVGVLGGVVKNNKLRESQATQLIGIVNALKSVEKTMKDFEMKSPEIIVPEINVPEVKVPAYKIPKFPEFPKTIGLSESKAIITALKDLKKELKDLPKRMPEVDVPRVISVDNFPPSKYPMPVTNININPLRGFVKSRSVTVTTSVTPLPGEVLKYRRSLIIYNNSTQTVEIGGSTMTFGTGLPLPPKTYSPPFDAGPRMILYGIVTAGTANLRVCEISNEDIGG